MNLVRVQLDLHRDEADALDLLKKQCRLSSRKDVIKTALAVIEWIRAETSAGRVIMAVGHDRISHLAVPGVTNSMLNRREAIDAV